MNENITVKQNAEKNGIEIYFNDGKPTTATLTELKANGWRWNRTKKCWYAKATEENAKYINQKTDTNITATATEAVKPKPKAPASPYSYNMYYVKDKKENKNYKCFYSIDVDSLDIKIYYDTYGHAPTPKGAIFKNDSDGQADYFEQSTVIIPPTAEDYPAVYEAYKKKIAKQRGNIIYNKPSADTLEAEKEITALLSAELSTEEIKKIITDRKEKRKQEKQKAYRQGEIATAKKWIEEGKATQNGKYCIYTAEHTYTELFSRTPIKEYTLIVIDLDTGERKAESGNYTTAEEREEKIRHYTA